MSEAAPMRSRPVGDLKDHAEAILRSLRRGRRPVLITAGGRTQAVLQSVADYEAGIERMRLLESILQGLRAEARGDTVPHAEAMRELDALLDD